MSKIVSFLFGKSSESRALISTSESLSSVSELDDEWKDWVSLDSLEEGEGSTIKGSVSSRERLLPKGSKPSQRDIVDSASLLSTPQREPFNLDHGGSQSEKSVPISGFEDQSLIARESFVGQSECDIDLSNCDRPWNVLLRIHRSSRKVKERRKYWRPVVVKLEEASLKFHADDFESFPPFHVEPLLWSHGFTVPNYKDSTGGYRRLLTSTLFNSTRGTTTLKRVFTTCPSMRKKAGLKVAKIGCTNHKALRDLIDTVQRCIFSFPGFRQRGIRYRKDRIFVDVQEVYEGVQNERESEIKAVTHVHVKVKALVSGSPKCSLSLNNSSSFGEQEAGAAKISFHKCVQEKKQLRPLVVTFVPLDNCWFEVIQMQSVSCKPPVLRCQVSLVVHVSTQIELRVQLFATTSEALPEAAPLKNVVLRFRVPLSMFKEGLVGNFVKNTHVSKGKLDFSSSNETMLWSISKLPLKTGKKFLSKHRELPLASFSSHFNPTRSFNADDFTKEPVYMDFMIRRKNMVAIEEITLESEKFHNLKTNYSSFFRVSIPVHVFRIS